MTRQAARPWCSTFSTANTRPALALGHSSCLISRLTAPMRAPVQHERAEKGVKQFHGVG
ncbi:MAG: hypothetical protein IPH54_21990 [Rhodoferax sp.]|nr:hypothetical protein [Rhodoferax sp.]